MVASKGDSLPPLKVGEIEHGNQVVSDQGDGTAIVVNHNGGDCLVEEDLLEMQHDWRLVIIWLELVVDASYMMNGRVIETMKVSAVLLFTFTRAVHMPSLSPCGVAFGKVMSPICTVLGLDDGIKFLLLWQSLPGGAIMELGTGKGSTMGGKGVILLTHWTFAIFNVLLFPSFSNLLLCQLLFATTRS